MAPHRRSRQTHFALAKETRKRQQREGEKRIQIELPPAAEPFRSAASISSEGAVYLEHPAFPAIKISA